jgi:hypothetical protein
MTSTRTIAIGIVRLRFMGRTHSNAFATAEPSLRPFLSAHFPPPMQVSTFFGVQMSSPV